jgi:DNA replication protein DnaC
MDTPQVLLEHYLKQLRLPTMVREYRKLGEQCAKEGATFEVFLLRLVEAEMMDRERRATERRIKAAKFPVSKSLESYSFLDMPTLNKKLVLDLARCEWIGRRENVLALGNSGTGKTHIGLALGLAACQQGFRVRFTTAAALVHELIEARDEKRLLRFQKNLSRQELLIVDELGFVPLSKAGAEMLFEILSQRYERSSTLVTSNLPFAEWTEVLGSERLTGVLLDRLTHHVHILEMNGESYRLKNSKKKKTPVRSSQPAAQAGAPKGNREASTTTRRAVEMPGLWKAWKAKSRLSPLSTSPLAISPKDGEIPTFPQLRRRRRMEKWKTKGRFPTFPPPRFLSP